jgi:hypothetical protein
MPADPIKAGRKGGSRNTPAQQAARKRNGFQRAAELLEQTGCAVDASKLVDYCLKTAQDSQAEKQIKNGGVTSVGEKALDAALTRPI